MTAAAISGTYSDLKLVKSRSVAQVVIEIPIEHAEKFIAAFGMPIPGAEKPVALALLKQSPTSVKPSPSQGAAAGGAEKTAGQRAVTRAALLCKDEKFQGWLGVVGEEAANKELKHLCRVGSKRELATDDSALKTFIAYETQYKMDTGQFAEQRG